MIALRQTMKIMFPLVKLKITVLSNIDFVSDNKR